MVRLIDNVRDWHRFWSVRLSLLGGALLTLAELGPTYLASVWSALPVEFQAAVPDSVVKYAGIALVILSPIARAIKQERLNAKAD